MTPASQIAQTAIRELTTPITTPKPPSAKFAEWLKFKTFGDPELEKIVDAASEWAMAFKTGRSPRWLALIGASGTGKTHICRRLWGWSHTRVNNDKTTHVPNAIFWPDFIQRLRGGDGYNERHDMKRWPVLFLDDIGAERDPSGFAAEELNTLLACRMDRWTLLTSNLDFDGLKRIDGRIASRLIRGRNICVSVNTKDFSAR